MFYTHTHSQMNIFDVCECVCVCCFGLLHNARSRRNCIFIAARCLYVLKSVLYLLFIYGLLPSSSLATLLFLFSQAYWLCHLCFSRQLCRFLSKVLCFFFSFRFSLRFLRHKWIFENGSSHMRLTASGCVCVCVDFGIGRNNDRDWYSALFRNNLHDS